MRLKIDKNTFMKGWQIAERVVSTKSTIGYLSGILCIAEGNTPALLATDLKTSISTLIEGVTVEEPGRAILPTKVLGELFKKIPASEFTVEVKDGKGKLLAGRNKYKFTTYPAEDFPVIPSSKDASDFVTLEAGELQRVIDEGGIAGSMGEEFPKYLGAELLQIKDGEFRCVSTDGRRLSLSKSYIETTNKEQDMLLPLGATKELLRILGTMNADSSVKIMVDGALGYFTTDTLEFSVRRVESTFPNYERILSPNTTTSLQIDRSRFISALERVDVVVRENNHMVVLNLSPGGDLRLTGRAADVGEVSEIEEGIIKGESLRVAFNVAYLIEGLKAFHGEQAFLTFNGQEGQMMMLRPNESDFLYMLMPIKLKSSDLDGLEEED